MSMLLMVQAFQLKLGCSTRKLILLKLADNASDDGWCWPSYNHIADMCEIDKRTVQRHVKQLEKEGYLIIKKRIGPKGNSSNLYHLTLDKSGGDNLPPPLKDIKHNTFPPEQEEIEAHDHPMAAHDHPMVAHDPLHGGTRSSESVIEPVNEPKDKKTSSFDNEHEDLKVVHLDKAFARLWEAWPNSKNKIRSHSAFKTLFRGKTTNVIDLMVTELRIDVQKRLDANQLGFSNMMLSTYLNNERFNDDITNEKNESVADVDAAKKASDAISRELFVDRYKK